MSAELRNVAGRLKDLTQCVICTETFTDARVLPCLHTFCLECLRLAGSDRRPYQRMPCPICRNEFSIPRAGFAGLQKNFLMENLLEMSSLPSVASPEEVFEDDGLSVPCDVCSEAAAAAAEEESHGNAEMTVTAEASARASASEEAAFRAPVAVVFCIDCRQSLCRLCYNHHKRVPATKCHRFSDDPRLVENFRKDIGHEAESVTEWLTEGAAKKQQLTEAMTKFTDDVKKVEEEITRIREEAKKTIESRADSLFQELTLSKQKHLAEYQSDLDRLEGHLAVLESFTKRCLHAKDREADHVVCRIVDDLKTTAEDLQLMHRSQCEEQVAVAKVSIKLNDLDEFLNRHGKETATNNATAKKETRPKGAIANGLPGRPAAAESVERSSDRTKQILALAVLVTSVIIAVILGSFVPKVPPVSIHLESKLAGVHGGVMGVTVVGDDLYVLSASPSRSILVYHGSDPFQLVKEIPIMQVNSPWDIVGSSESKSLYISDQEYSCIWKVTLDEVPTSGWFARSGHEHQVSLWLTDITEPYTLSTSSDGHVLLLRSGKHSFIEKYSSEAILVHRVELPAEIEDPRHVLETSTETYIVSFGWSGSRSQGVAELTVDGSVTRTYDAAYEWQQLKNPHHLAIDAEDRVFVADFYNNRVLLLDLKFNWDQKVILSEETDDISKPHRLCLTKSNQLIVAHSDGETVDIFTLTQS